MPNIEDLKLVYQQIESETGVPWTYIAAIHFREGNNNPDSSIFAGEKLGSINPDNGQVQGTTLEENGVKAAEHFKAMAKNSYQIDVTDPNLSPEDLAKAFVAYNRGVRYKRASAHIGRVLSATESPYAMNGLEGHENMHFPNVGGKDGGSWGEPESTQGKADSRPGAIAVVEALDHDVSATPSPTSIVAPAPTTTEAPARITTTTVAETSEPSPTSSEVTTTTTETSDSTDTTSTTSSTTTSTIKSQEQKTKGTDAWISREAALKAFRIYFTADGATDESALKAWVNALKINSDGKYRVNVFETPDKDKRGNI